MQVKECYLQEMENITQQIAYYRQIYRTLYNQDYPRNPVNYLNNDEDTHLSHKFQTAKDYLQQITQAISIDQWRQQFRNLVDTTALDTHQPNEVQFNFILAKQQEIETQLRKIEALPLSRPRVVAVNNNLVSRVDTAISLLQNELAAVIPQHPEPPPPRTKLEILQNLSKTYEEIQKLLQSYQPPNRAATQAITGNTIAERVQNAISLLQREVVFQPNQQFQPLSLQEQLLILTTTYQNLEQELKQLKTYHGNLNLNTRAPLHSQVAEAQQAVAALKQQFNTKVDQIKTRYGINCQDLLASLNLVSKIATLNDLEYDLRQPRNPYRYLSKVLESGIKHVTADSEALRNQLDSLAREVNTAGTNICSLQHLWTELPAEAQDLIVHYDNITPPQKQALETKIVHQYNELQQIKLWLHGNNHYHNLIKIITSPQHHTTISELEQHHPILEQLWQHLGPDQKARVLNYDPVQAAEHTQRYTDLSTQIRREYIAHYDANAKQQMINALGITPPSPKPQESLADYARRLDLVYQEALYQHYYTRDNWVLGPDALILPKYFMENTQRVKNQLKYLYDYGYGQPSTPDHHKRLIKFFSTMLTNTQNHPQIFGVNNLRHVTGLINQANQSCNKLLQAYDLTQTYILEEGLPNSHTLVMVQSPAGINVFQDNHQLELNALQNHWRFQGAYCLSRILDKLMPLPQNHPVDQRYKVTAATMAQKIAALQTLANCGNVCYQGKHEGILAVYEELYKHDPDTLVNKIPVAPEDKIADHAYQLRENTFQDATGLLDDYQTPHTKNYFRSAIDESSGKKMHQVLGIGPEQPDEIYDNYYKNLTPSQVKDRFFLGKPAPTLAQQELAQYVSAYEDFIKQHQRRPTNQHEFPPYKVGHENFMSKIFKRDANGRYSSATREYREVYEQVRKQNGYTPGAIIGYMHNAIEKDPQLKDYMEQKLQEQHTPKELPLVELLQWATQQPPEFLKTQGLERDSLRVDPAQLPPGSEQKLKSLYNLRHADTILRWSEHQTAAALDTVGLDQETVGNLHRTWSDLTSNNAAAIERAHTAMDYQALGDLQRLYEYHHQKVYFIKHNTLISADSQLAAGAVRKYPTHEGVAVLLTLTPHQYLVNFKN